MSEEIKTFEHEGRKITEIVSQPREIFQMTMVVYGWGYVFDRQDDSDEDWYEARQKYIQALCSYFCVEDVSEVDSKHFSSIPYWSEVEESITFECDDPIYLKYLQQYLLNDPNQCPIKKEGADAWVNAIWDEYNSKHPLTKTQKEMIKLLENT